MPLVGWITDQETSWASLDFYRVGVRLMLRGFYARCASFQVMAVFRRLPVASAVLAALIGAAAGPARSSASAASSPGTSGAQPAADTVFLDGQVLLYPKSGGSPLSPQTVMSPSVAWAQAVAVKDGRIIFIGDTPGARKRIGPMTLV